MGVVRALGIAAVALAAAAPACRSPRRSDTVTVSVPYEVGTLDPHAKNSLSSFAVVSNFYEPLVTTDPEMKVQPCLARSWENPDPSTWVFHLRREARFHSGQPLRAADVVYSIRRLMKDEGLQIGGYVLYVRDVEVVDDHTVRMHTSRPLSVLLNKLRFVHVVPEGASEGALAASPNGTGPFRLVEWDKGRRLRIARNEAYWGPRPRVAEAVYLLDRTADDAASDLVEGRAEVAQCNSKAAEARVRADGRFRIDSRPSLFLKYLGYDIARARTPYVASPENPFLKLAVRRALSLAVHRDALVEALSSRARPANQLVPPAIFGFNPRLPPLVHDAERARALLAEAGHAGGFRAELHVRKPFAEAATILAARVRPVGFDFEVKVLPDEEALERLRRRDTSVFLSRFGCPTGDASDILDNTLHTTDLERRMGIQNYGGWGNADIDRAIEESAGVDSVPDRRDSLERIMARLMAEMVWVPLYVDEDVYGIHPRVAWRPRSDSFVLAADMATQ